MSTNYHSANEARPVGGKPVAQKASSSSRIPFFRRITTKIALGFGAISLLVAVCSLVGVQGIRQLSQHLAHLTGPAWSAADGAMEASIHVEAQMLATSELIHGKHSADLANRALASATLAQTAVEQVESAGIVESDVLSPVKEGLKSSRRVLSTLVDRHQKFRESAEKIQQLGEMLTGISNTIRCRTSSSLNDLQDASSHDGENPSWVAAWRSHACADALHLLILSQERGVTQAIQAWQDENEGALDPPENLVDVMEAVCADESLQVQITEGELADDLFRGQTYVEALRTSYESYATELENVRRALPQLRQSHEELTRIEEGLLESLGKAEEVGDGAIDEIAEIVPALTGKLLRLVTGTAAVSLIMAVAAGFWFTRLIGRPIRRMIHELRYIIGEADLSARLDRSSQDEMGAIAAEINAFVSNVQSITNKTAANSQSLREAAETLSRSGEEMKENSSSMADALREMSVSIQEITRSATQSAMLAREASHASQQGISRIEELSTLMDNIGQVVTMIHGIAEQTNLLALNATIEAARASTAGKGFAVVATEVKELARQTTDATTQIEKRIQQIQQACRLLTVSMSDIDRVIGNVDEMSQTIAAAVEQQNAVSQQITEQVRANARMAEDLSGSLSAPVEAAALIVTNISHIDRNAVALATAS